MQKIIDLIKALVILTVILCSCSPKHLSKTGDYFVKDAEPNQTYKFYFVKGQYLITDSILPKKNSKIRLTGTRDTSKVNVFLLTKK